MADEGGMADSAEAWEVRGELAEAGVMAAAGAEAAGSEVAGEAKARVARAAAQAVEVVAVAGKEGKAAVAASVCQSNEYRRPRCGCNHLRRGRLKKDKITSRVHRHCKPVHPI